MEARVTHESTTVLFLFNTREWRVPIDDIYHQLIIVKRCLFHLCLRLTRNDAGGDVPAIILILQEVSISFLSILSVGHFL